MTTSEEPPHVKDISGVDSLEQEDVSSRRLGGDGESLPNTPPNEIVEVSQKNSETGRNPFTYQINVDLMAVMLFVLGLVTRMYRLDQPRNVV